MERGEGEPPETGSVAIHALTPAGLYETRGPLADFVEGRHPLAPLFALGNGVFTQLRLVSEQMGPPPKE